MQAAELNDRLLLEEQLVLADALQDGGDPRGHLLALHLAIERAPDDQTLVAAAKDHVAEHAEDLIGPLAPHHRDPGLTLEWHRGYVKGASLDTEDTPACLDALLQIPMVHTLTDLRVGRAAGCLPVFAAHRPHLRHLEYGIDALGRPVLDAPLASLAHPAVLRGWCPAARPARGSRAALARPSEPRLLRRLRRLELRGAVGWDAHAAIDRFPSEFAHLDEFLIVDRSAPANRQTPAESSADACRIHPSAGNARCSPT